MSTDPQGKLGPHPDLLDLMAAHFTESLARAGRTIAIARGDLEMLQQRTFADRPHPDTRIGASVTVSSCLAVLRPRVAATSGAAMGAHLLLFQALRAGATGWTVVASTLKGLGDPPLQPFVGTVLVTRLGLTCGAFVSNARVARQRVELADGTVFEEAVANDSLCHFVPFRSPAAWAADAAVRLFDIDGNAIVAQAVYVAPTPPAGVAPGGIAR